MHTFADKTGRPWVLVLDTDTIRRVRDLLKINIAVEAANGSLFDRLELDPVLLADVLFAICKPQADAAKISSEDFGRALAGDVIEHATAALIEELLDFFPQDRRSVLRAMLSTGQAVQKAARKQLCDAMAAVDPTQSAMKLFGAGSTNLPASSGSTPAPLPSAD